MSEILDDIVVCQNSESKKATVCAVVQRGASRQVYRRDAPPLKSTRKAEGSHLQGSARTLFSWMASVMQDPSRGGEIGCGVQRYRRYSCRPLARG